MKKLRCATCGYEWTPLVPGRKPKHFPCGHLGQCDWIDDG